MTLNDSLPEPLPNGGVLQRGFDAGFDATNLESIFAWNRLD